MAMFGLEAILCPDFWLRMGFGLRFVSELGWGLGLGLDFCLCLRLELSGPCGCGSGWGCKCGVSRGVSRILC